MPLAPHHIHTAQRTAEIIDNRSRASWHADARYGRVWEVRMEGSGHWCSGPISHHFTRREDAEACKRLWLAHGVAGNAQAERRHKLAEAA